jgi:hypothetical protein
MTHKPSIGRIVHYYMGDFEAAEMGNYLTGIEGYEKRRAFVEENGKALTGQNGSRLHPAMITQVFSDTCVNLKIFFSAGPIENRSSCTLLPPEAFGKNKHCVNSGWVWPERV